MGAFIERTVAEIRQRVGPTDRVICGLSGGVDSAVARGAAGSRRSARRSSCIFVDNGLLRAGRGGRRSSRRSAATSRPTCASSMRRSGSSTRSPGVTDPQEKRSPDRPRVHRRLPRRGASRSPDAKFLAQGTLYPDVIESGGDRRRPGRDDQAPPQRRRPAGRARLRADRAAPRPVQGRGPPPRPGARPARHAWSGGTRSPAPAWRSAASAR